MLNKRLLKLQKKSTEDKFSLPSLKSFLEVADSKKTISRETLGKDIAVLSMISAAQVVYDDLGKDQKKKVDEILANKENVELEKILSYFSSINKAREYSKALADAANYWTIDLIKKIYSSLSIKNRKTVDEKWPDLKRVANDN